jgi:2-amino-4-hydroxy-6-hydroxymethyldihydropteridine diphosphokinase
MKLTQEHKESLACFSLGSNLGDRVAYLERASLLLESKVGRLAYCSPMYESASWGYQSDLPYINSCLALYTKKEPLQLMEIALEIEKQMGRSRQGSGYADRVIDIDLLLVNDVIMDHPRLILPHPRMMERRFVLVPLNEILPEMRHPKSGQTISEILKSCPDQSPITPV